MGELEARVGQHVQEEAVALPQHYAHAIVGQRLHPLDRAEVALEVGRSAHLAVGLVAVDGQLEPQLHILRREGRAVMPENIVPEGERPLRLRGVHGPGRGQVGAGQVQVLPAAHHQVAWAEEGAAHMVQGDAARAHRVEARGRVAAVGQDHNAAVRPVGRGRSRGGRRNSESRSGAVRGGSSGGLTRSPPRGGRAARCAHTTIAGAGQCKERTARSQQRSSSQSHDFIVLAGSPVHKGEARPNPGPRRPAGRLYTGCSGCVAERVSEKNRPS